MNSTTNPILLKYAVLLTSLSQILSPLFSSLNNQSKSGQSLYANPRITPAGYAFVVWGAITILSLMYGLYQLRRNNKNQNLHRKVSPMLIVVYILFSVWLVAAEFQWLFATIFVFVVIFYFLRKILIEVIQQEGSLTLADKILLRVQIGIYTGWTSVAIFANIASAVKFNGVSDEGVVGTAWQAGLLVFATANIIWCIYSFKGDLAYVIAALWAVVGVYVGLQDEKEAETLKVVTAVLGTSVLIIYLLYIRASRKISTIKMS